MTDFAAGVCVGLFAGTLLGVLTLALCVAGKQADERAAAEAGDATAQARAARAWRVTRKVTP